MRKIPTTKKVKVVLTQFLDDGTSKFSKQYSKILHTVSARAYNTPLLIKPPLQPNLNKPPLFCPKSPLFKAFWGKNPKNFNKPPPKNPQIFINRRRTIGADTVFIVLTLPRFSNKDRERNMGFKTT